MFGHTYRKCSSINGFKLIAGILISIAGVLLINMYVELRCNFISRKEGVELDQPRYTSARLVLSRGHNDKESYVFSRLNLSGSEKKKQLGEQPIDEQSTEGPGKDQIFYLKIGRTGSTTVMHIFHSYGYRHKLNLVLSTVGGHQINPRDLHPGPESSWIVGPASDPIDLFAQHITYDQTFQEKLFPDQTTTLITSLREPVKFFISYVDYMYFLYSRATPRTVLHDDTLFFKRCKRLNGLKLTTRNMFLQWFGFGVNKMDDTKAIQEYIKFLDAKFDLVLVSDHFDESLILLKRLMNWDMTDIFYRYSNKATKKSGIMFNETEVEKLLDEKHNHGDKLLFDYFNQTLWEKIGREKEFTEEVNEFRTRNEEVRAFCKSEIQKEFHNGTLTIETKWDGQMTITDENCLAVWKPEFLESKLEDYIPARIQLLEENNVGVSPWSCQN